MFPISTIMGGTATATVPDVCKVPAPPAPPIPTPFPNIGQVMQVIPTTASLFTKVAGASVVLKPSQIAMTNGDQAGVLGGMKSSMIMGPGKFTTFSQTVKIEGKNACYVSCLTEHNGSSSNTIGLQAAPSQVLVLISP